MTGTLTLIETDEFYFDEVAAERPIKFIEKFCTHYEGRRWKGKPFLLHDSQKHLVQNLFGWKWKATGRRRFTDCYWEGAIGSGKSPLLAALGLYGLMADNEPGAQIYSLSSTYRQGKIVFENAKKFIKLNRDLSARLKVCQFEIRYAANHSTWAIVSGDGPGAGCRPSMILGDEAHEWQSAAAYDDLHDRQAKRDQPICIVATNSGKSRASFCWQLREKAIAALEGRGEVTLYPVIWAADESAATDDPAAWRAANPLMGITIDEAKVARTARKKMEEGAAEEADFRRLYLSIWPKQLRGRWLNLALWDACKSDEKPPADATLYVGADLSECDDLCAVVWTWVTSEAPGTMFMDAHFWLPRCTAEMYQEKEEIPYLDWAGIGCLTLVDAPTITREVREAIANTIIAKGNTHPIKAVCYDRFKADATVAALEAAGLICVPVAQGYTVSPGCNELERRMKEGSIVISSNPLLRFCAENCEVKQDDRGNIWPVKPNARGRYAGKRGAKIDGISAAVTVLTEARKHAFAPARKFYRGQLPCKV